MKFAMVSLPKFHERQVDNIMTTNDRSPYQACKRILKIRGDVYAGDIRVRGIDAIRAMDAAFPELQQAWPSRIFELSCDDSAAASSALYVITDEVHGEDGVQWAGANLLFIPQCTGEAPIFVGLSDGEFDALRDVLNALAKRAAEMPVFGDDGQDVESAAIDALNAFEQRYKHCDMQQKMALLMEMKSEVTDRIQCLEEEMAQTTALAVPNPTPTMLRRDR